ncbi:TPA: hypothetical protein I8271_001051 [Kluyvera intermedia]|uniref:Uncharacterized protein n=2 Tax=Enterobacteriaceae TaxID=543 RepID=A0AAC8TNY8_9ENTR|nr:YjeJ family protein [Phytobacter ursingii]MDU6684098.1 YjeJ family protein [Enterobacteriaceae bacterium]HAT2204237.1 hypothetical protein [Kluyvera intermedia]AKL13984.1 hypothetical protein AB182_23025 [Phytobacter ursingii]HAT2514950.1 hypothetical protein [Kluyvera intermedia]HAT2602702.1 hypothetical protein [Kluyvera intermedia]
MEMNIAGINAGVIRNNEEFLAVALKLNIKNSDSTLLFFPALTLRDLFIAMEYYLHKQKALSEDQRKDFIAAQTAVTKTMHAHIPGLKKEELENADIDYRVDAIDHFAYDEGKLIFTLRLHNNEKFIFEIHELQIELLTHVLIHAINNAGMQDLALRMSSLLDFLPLYDVDCQPDGKMIYDTYTQPDWKTALFDHYLILLYHYADAEKKSRFCAAVIKTRSLPDTPETQAIAKRLLAFSPRLGKLTNKACQVHIQAINVKGDEPLNLDKCMHTLNRIRHQITAKPLVKKEKK